MTDKQAEAQDLQQLRALRVQVEDLRRRTADALAQRLAILVRRRRDGTSYRALARACGVSESILARQVRQHDGTPRKGR